MRLNEVYEEWKSEVDFVCVYIKEAHPEDGWQTQTNIDADVRLYAPTNLDERAELAQMCVLKLNLAMPMVIDDMSDAIDDLYRAGPERLYLVDPKGRIAYRGDLGPWGFDVEQWREAIADALATSA